MGRTLPHLEAEEYLLSCCLLDRSATVGKARCAAHNPRLLAGHALVFNRTKIHRRGQHRHRGGIESCTASSSTRWVAF